MNDSTISHQEVGCITMLCSKEGDGNNGQEGKGGAFEEGTRSLGELGE